MKEQYSVEEILNAVEEFQTVKQKTVSTDIKNEKQKKISIIPANTLKLIEEAEQSVKSKSQSE